MAKLLLEHGADKSIKTNDGKTAKDFAHEKGFTEIAELL
jgi:ankyrin repeat protein